LDLTTIDDKNVGSKVHFLEEDSAKTLDTVATLVQSQCSTAEVNRDFGDAVKALGTKQQSPTRWISTSGDVIWVVVLFNPGTDREIEIEETRRKTHLAGDLAALADLVKKGGFNASHVAMAAFPYVLTETRADLTVKVASVDEKNAVAVISLKSGPAEYFSLSANLPVTSVSQLTIDSQQQVVTKQAPKEFLVGFDWNFGDVYSDYSMWNLSRGFVTAMARFSKQPLDTLGVGLGYNFGPVSLFGGPLGIRQPTSASAAGTAVAMRYKVAWRLGVAFDLGTAAGWVSPKAK